MGFGAKTFNWNEIGEPFKITSEELLLSNTFKNSRINRKKNVRINKRPPPRKAKAMSKLGKKGKKKKKPAPFVQTRVTWMDGSSNDQKKLVTW